MGHKRIAICGAAGTGKTRMITEINKIFGLEVNPVGSRSVAKNMGYDNPYDVDKFGRREEFQYLLMSDKVEWEQNHDDFITDRTTFDVLAYTALHDIRAVNKQFISMAAKGYERYTHVFFFPMEEFFNLGNDPARMKSEVYHEIYEGVMISLMDRYVGVHSAMPIRIGGDEIEERKKNMLEHLVD